MYLPATQSSFSPVFDKTDGVLMSTDILSVMSELRTNSRISTITYATCFIKTQIIIAKIQLGQQTNEYRNID